MTTKTSKVDPEKSGEQGARLLAPTGSLPSSTLARVSRDGDTLALIGEFLVESEDGLVRADQILMDAERGQASVDSVHAIFRVFHSIKGVSGFLELPSITTLAHTTENMLDRCRDGRLSLASGCLDLVFEATAMLRRMLGELKRAAETGVAFETQEPVSLLVAKIAAANQAGTGPQGRSGERVDVDGAASAPVEAASASLIPLDEVRNVSEEQVDDAGGARPTTGGAKLRETIKVDVERVDSLVEMIGELVVVEAMVVGAPEIAGSVSVRVRSCLAQLDKVTRDLQDVGMRMRMVPVSGEFQKLVRMARDLGRKSGKKVRVVLAGESTEMDRSMVEQVASPLVHMIRNAIDHGLEPADERLAAGKTAEGTIRLSAYHEGGGVVIEIVDDGRGLDSEAILAKARVQNLIGPRDVLSQNEIYALIFAPGFSTAKQVTEISGRGVGMDVVRRSIEAMRGRISIESTPGKGTTFRIVLPLTLAIIDGMLVACGHERYIIPTLSILESLKPSAAMLATMTGVHEMINVRGEILPLLRLDRLLHTGHAEQVLTESLVVILEGAGRRFGLIVDEVITQQQVVIKSLGRGVGDAKYFSGAAILSDGRVGLIVNVEAIADTFVDRRHRVTHDVDGPSPLMAASGM
jgi:two-component system chemotaxis sensor kinase CheA